MELNKEEKELLEGKKGPVLKKIMKSLVLYGEALGAEIFADIEYGGHFSISAPIPGTALSLEILAELLEAGLKTKYPFTLDPRPPLNFPTLALTHEQEESSLELLRDNDYYQAGMVKLGLKDQDAYTCTPYFTEVGHIPKRDQILAWSASSCVIYANSVIGARTHRNAAIMDILSNIIGKTPLCGLLTDEGRRASWLIRLNTSKLPHPQLLGGVIGQKVVEDVPYIVGIDKHLGLGINEITVDYLKELGTACASIGGVGLFHVENITPEAVEKGKGILKPNHNVYVIDDRDIAEHRTSFPVLWKDKNANPQKCIIGCTQQSLRQLHWWADNIHEALAARGKDKLSVKTIISVAPQILKKFKEDKKSYDGIVNAGVLFADICPQDYMDNELCARDAVITNSNKLKIYSTARFFPDDELIDIIADGKIKKEE